MKQTDNLNISRFKPLISPDELKAELPGTDEVADLVANSRVSVHKILTNQDRRRLVIAGPCSL
ncbi:MAG: 3-deoxy-7-phosphoheptulonate synthase, partial [Phycisphaerales bacterium]